ncbi:MAG: hypothetical protein EB127_07795 [Alphaproteobacteria bacterium]|nr:hypothetical protein [Alphaproteobacteria bacterium]
MTEIEELKAQIKMLQSKLSFLEELEKTKSPVEEAYKDWWGEYPGDENWTSDATRWQGFQAGYNAAYEEKVSEEPEELKTLYQMFYDKCWSEPNCDVFCDIVKEWMSQYTHNMMTGEYLKGYEECLTVLEENLK